MTLPQGLEGPLAASWYEGTWDASVDQLHAGAMSKSGVVGNGGGGGSSVFVCVCVCVCVCCRC